MRSNRNLKRERSDGILKESKSVDDLKKYQECAKKLDECSKNLLRLCQVTNQGLYDDEIERAANEILRKEEAEAKKIAEELRHQRGVLHRTQGSNRTLLETSERNLQSSSKKSLRETSRRDVMYSGSSAKPAGYTDQNPCNQRPMRCDTSGMGEVPDMVLNCNMNSIPHPGSRGVPGATPMSQSPYQPGMAPQISPQGREHSSTRYAPQGTTLRYGPCTDAGNNFGNSYGNQENSRQFQDVGRWTDYQGPPIGDSRYTDEPTYRQCGDPVPKRAYVPNPTDSRSTWGTYNHTTVPPRDFSSSFPSGGRNPIGNTGDSMNQPSIPRAKSQTTQLTSNGKCPIHIVITAASDNTPTPQTSREPLLTDCNDEENRRQQGDTYLSKEDANRFLQCVLNCWNQMNQKTETPKDSNHPQSSLTDDRLIEFCSNLTSKSGKKKDRKRRDKSKSKKSGVSTDCQPRCFVCMPTDCTEGDGHSSKKESKSKEKSKGQKKDWQGECLKIFKELQSCRKKGKKQTVSRGSNPEPCNEVYREIGFMSQDPCMDYYNNAQDPGEPWGQPGADWRSPWGSEYSGNPAWQQWQPQDPGAWGSPQTLVGTPNLSPSASPASSTTEIKTAEVDTSMLLAIARAAINLSMEHHKDRKQKGKRKNLSDDEDEESSFCDILESIFGQ